MVGTNYDDAAGQSLPWYDVWMEVVSHPSRDSFRRILADPKWSATRAFIWIAILGMIFGVLQGVLTQVFGASLGGSTNMGLALVCSFIFVPIASVIGLALSAGIYHGIAKLLGGTGTFDKMVYCLGAVEAPVSIFSYLITFVSMLATGGGFGLGTTGNSVGSLATLCLLPFSLAVGIYSMILFVLAIDTVENIGTGKAVLTMFIPVIIGILLGVCMVVGLGASLATLLNR